MKEMTVKQIVVDYLKKNGYDGLCCDCCQCYLTNYMVCVENDSLDVETGYEHIGAGCIPFREPGSKPKKARKK